MSLIDCFKTVPPADRDKILLRMKALQRGGMDNPQAIQAAVAEYSDDILSEIDNIFKQLGDDRVLVVKPSHGSKTAEKVDKKRKEIDSKVKELLDLIGEGGAGAVADPKKDAERQYKITIKAAELVRDYVELGVLRFEEMARDVYEQYGEPALRTLFDAMKRGYGAIRETAEDITGFDDLETSRKHTADSLIKKFKQDDDKTGANADQGPGRPGSVDSGVNAPGSKGGTQPAKAGESKGADAGASGDVLEQGGGVQGKRDDSPGGPYVGGPRVRRTEPVDANIQQNYLYPENWERNRNKTFSKRQAYADNIAALEVINDLLSKPNTFATEEQKSILAKYNGLGPLVEILLPQEKAGWNKTSSEYYNDAMALRGLLAQIGEKTKSDPIATAKTSTLSAYYTSLPVIRAIWKAVQAGGFTGGRMIEGSVGSGRFIGGMPSELTASTKVKGVDMDVVSSLIAKYLYPKAAISNSTIQQASLPSNTYDLYISNMPFGDVTVYDPILDKKGSDWRSSQSKLHTYFFAKAIDVVRPGGYVAVITSANALDTPSNQPTRELIERETDFVGAVRMPSSTFSSDAGTSVVTDVVILRKKLAPSKPEVSQISDITKKVVDHKYGEKQQEIRYNSYFDKHPENLLGTEMKAGGMYSSDSGYILEGEIDPDKLAERLSDMTSKMPILEEPTSQEETAETLQITAVGRTVSGGIVKQNGKYYTVLGVDNNGEATLEEIPESMMPAVGDRPILKEFVDLKNTYFDVLALDKVDKEATKERKHLKDTLIKFMGTIKPMTLQNLGGGKKAINRLLSKDPDFYAVTALIKPDGKFADIIEKPLPKQAATLVKTDNPSDAIAYSINNFGKINIGFIQKVLGVASKEEAMDIIEPEVFETLDGEIIEKTEYLSGNVREKLEQAQEWAQVNKKFDKNVEALTKAIPQDIPTEKIKFQFGASWVPLKHFQNFLDLVFGKGMVKIRYTKETDNYDVQSSVVGGEYEAIGETLGYSYDRGYYALSEEEMANLKKEPNPEKRDAATVIKAALTKNVPDVVKTIKTSEGEMKIPLPRLTQDIRDKAERLQSEFEGLILNDPATRKELTDLYNKKFNGIALRKYDGSRLTFPEMQGFELDPHQKDAIMMLITRLGGMVDHVVGAGKSLVMGAGAIKMKQLGLIKKPMITTMKSVVPGMKEQLKRQYPSAKILFPTEKDFSSQNRQRLFAQIANNDWDLIIITHENLGTIPLPEDFQKEYIDNEIKVLLIALKEIASSSGGKEDKYSADQMKAIEKMIEKLRAKLEKIQDKGEGGSKTDFGTMGIDMLMVDESQQFKNLGAISKLRNVAGLGTSKKSERAANLKMVTRYLQKMHGGDKGVVFASGTPISNSIVEVYNIFQYLRPSLLNKLEMVSLDQFLKNFGEITSIMEKNVAGVVKNRNRLTKFVNVPELAAMYAEISDIRSVHNLKLERPDLKTELLLVDQSQTQRKITKAIYDASKTTSVGPLNDIGINPKGDAKKALGLVLTTLGKKASIDPRLVFPGTKADGGKIFKLVDQVAKIYKETEGIKGTQLVFADMGVPKKKGASLGARLFDEMLNVYGEDYLNEYSQADSVWRSKTNEEAKAKLMEVFELNEDEAQTLIDEANNVDGFNVYDEVKKQLIEKGVPGNEIAFIHDANSADAKDKLFQAVNEGKVRIMLGSTGKMGTGVNVQRRVTDMHHLDINWRPSDLEQRVGRGQRRGNMNKEVRNWIYGTKETIDSYVYQVVANKQYSIDVFRAGGKGIREMEFEDGESMTLAEFAAHTSGDTRILDLEKAKSKLAKLRNRIESAKRANVLREQRIQEAKEELTEARALRDLATDVEKRLREIPIQEVEEIEQEEGKKPKTIKKKTPIFIGVIDGKKYDTSIRSEREEFYIDLAVEVNRLRARKDINREPIGFIADIPIYTKGLRGMVSGNIVESGRRIDLGDTPDNVDSPVPMTIAANLFHEGSMRTYVMSAIENASEADGGKGTRIAQKRYENAVVANEQMKNAGVVSIKDDEVKEMEQAQEQVMKIQESLRKSAEGKDEEPPEGKKEEDGDDTPPPTPPDKPKPKDPLTDISKRNEENYEKFKGAMSTGLPIPVVGKVKKKPDDQRLIDFVRNGHMTQKELEAELDRQLQMENPEVEKRMVDASKPVNPNAGLGLGGKIGEFVEGFKSHFRHLSEKLFPREANLLREFEGLRVWANGRANIYVRSLISPLSKRQYNILTRRIILGDMMDSIDKGLNMTGLDGKLPFGLSSVEEVQRELWKYDDFMKADPDIQKAFEVRQSYMNELKDKLVSAGLLSEPDIAEYYHRRVIAYMNDELNKEILFGKTLGDKTRDFQRGRRGTRGMDYSTNFIETEFKVVAEAEFEMEKQKILQELMAPFEKELKALIDRFNKEFAAQREAMIKEYGEDHEQVKLHESIRRELKKEFLNENLPPGYVFYRVDDRNRLFWGRTISESAIQNAMDQASGQVPAMDIVDQLINSIDTGLMVGAKRKQYMIPEPLANQLEEMAKDKDMPNFLVDLTSYWKQWMLLSPFRLFRYNLNNMGGDIDRALQVDPTMLKHTKSAIKELWDFHKYGVITDQLSDAMRGSVIDSGFAISELADMSQQEWATHFLDKTGGPSLQDIFGKKVMKELAMASVNKPGSMLQAYLEKVGKYVRLRENVLRYAAYKRAVEKVEAGEEFVWASRPQSIKGIEDKRQKAAKLAREAFGDYGNISYSGEQLRKVLVPFYSWLEINMGTTIRLIKNANSPSVQREMIKQAVLRGIPGVIVRMALANAKILSFTAMVQLWNRYLYAMMGGDDDAAEKLRRDKVRGMQFIVATDERGFIKTLPIAGAFYDFIDYFGIPTAWDETERFMIGKGEGTAILNEIGSQMINRSSQMVTPFVKAPIELTAKRSYFPDVFNPVPFDDRWEYLAGLLTMRDEYNYLLTDKPMKEGYLSRKWNNSLLLREFDPGMLAYYRAKNIVQDYTGQTPGTSEPKNPVEIAKKKAIRYYTQNLRNGNYEEADKNLNEYYKMGGNRRSLEATLRSADPFSGLKKTRRPGEPISEWDDLENRLRSDKWEPRTAFVKQLTDEDLLVMKDAMEYFSRMKRKR